MEKVYSIWKTGYSASSALGVSIVGETDKAYKFQVLDSAKGYTFFMPKKAIKFDPNNEGILILQNWFIVEGFIAFLFDRYANYYKR
jgi:hypothetical protein